MPQNVAVIIVNYATAALAGEAVRSVLAQPSSETSVTVHLLDNASPGDDAAQLSAMHRSENWGARVILHLEDENHGFGRANNIALSALMKNPNPPAHVLLLNPDATLAPGSLAEMSEFLSQHPKVGCVGAQISEPGAGPVSAAFRFPSAFVDFISAAAIGPLTRAAGNRTLWHAPDLPTQQVDWVAGAAVMFRLDALQECGLFDPDFFLYFEEVELIWRLRQHGWSCWYLTDARVSHHAGAATKVRSGDGIRERRPVYWYASQRMYYAKTGSRVAAIGCAVARFSGACLNVVSKRIRGKTPDHPTHYISDFLRHVLVPLVNPFAAGN